MSKRGFTLIELMVVISIITLISSVVFGAVSTARAKAQNTKTLSQRRAIQAGLTAFQLEHGAFPACPGQSNQGKACCIGSSACSVQGVAITGGDLMSLINTYPDSLFPASANFGVTNSSDSVEGFIYYCPSENSENSDFCDYTPSITYGLSTGAESITPDGTATTDIPDWDGEPTPTYFSPPFGSCREHADCDVQFRCTQNDYYAGWNGTCEYVEAGYYCNPNPDEPFHFCGINTNLECNTETEECFNPYN